MRTIFLHLANRSSMKQKIERVTISGKVVAIRAQIDTKRGGRYRKQFIVNEAMSEKDAIAAAREYTAFVINKLSNMPDENEVIKIAESIVEKAKTKETHNRMVVRSAKQDVSEVRRRYPLTTTIFGYINSLGEWCK